MPKLERIDGKVRHYPYTPAGRAAYLRDKGKQDNTAESRRQSNMAMEADYNDQSKGAEDYINKKYGKSGIKWFPTDFSSYKEFENAVLDVISEGEVSSKFPNNVWERAAKRYTKRVFAEQQAKSGFKPSGDSSDKRMSNRILDRMNVPTDYREQMIAEKDMDATAKKYVKNKGKRVKKGVK